MKIDINKLNRNTGLGLTRKETALHEAQKQIDFLSTHNKNLTKAQYESVMILKEIIDSIKE